MQYNRILKRNLHRGMDPVPYGRDYLRLIIDLLNEMPTRP